VTTADDRPSQRSWPIRCLWFAGSVMAAASGAFAGLNLALVVGRNMTAAYCVAWLCWAVILFVINRLAVFRVRSRQKLVSDTLVYGLGSALELVVWINAKNTLAALNLFPDALLVSALISAFVPILLHVTFIFFYLQMVVFRRLFHATSGPGPDGV
jgi:putative flippase GtrA